MKRHLSMAIDAGQRLSCALHDAASAALAVSCSFKGRDLPAPEPQS